IAAANALSDVYAMGAKPLTMLSIVGFPVDTLPMETLVAALRGGAEKAQEAGVSVVGGHSIDDPEPKIGYAVVGTVHPDQVYRLATARLGDVLVLTKPLSMGIISTAIKRERASSELIEAATQVMATLNRAASEVMVAVGASACTDVTGYGLLGHLHTMAHSSGVSARLHSNAVPVLDGVWPLVREGLIPGGTRRNRHFLEQEGALTWAETVAEEALWVLSDAQTSGGLLISVPEDHATLLLTKLREAGVTWAAAIGEVVPGPPGHILVEP
ncbi:MAG: selenide, water dikinase SelD, partial [Chloroflexi bacterium]|nr:selenide, water dikinase SelD [Chloroflexota bacterium]